MELDAPLSVFILLRSFMASDVLRDGVHRLYQGVLYFLSIMLCTYTLTCNFVYSKKSMALPAPVFTKLQNVQDHQMQISNNTNNQLDATKTVY